eukprot:CAMPEP_0170570110 /NCGR_PEP_ID=MMETSP0224-20130122/929_1 /TAXON_ID=285029 /ORGANISM="Togula jolla, Strain CCCM 725" /LENGTH=84 /DNA_ID=CAMNT_0010892353 /DNA_START=530 /DNA_END=784 /DNA_ORIENTATION=+
MAATIFIDSESTEFCSESATVSTILGSLGGANKASALGVACLFSRRSDESLLLRALPGILPTNAELLLKAWERSKLFRLASTRR